ncbi:MAG: glycosyltransferase [Phycisphaerales bacterium]|nr:glycosyltransferase [Phycisphaerales bacterium]
MIPLRVLHLVESLRPTAGSVATVLPGLFKALADRGWTSTVATRDVPPESTDGVDVTSCSPDAITQPMRSANVVHVHGGERAFLSSILPAIRRSAVPCVFAPLGALCPNPFEADDWRNAMADWFFRRRLRRTATIFAAANEAERHELAKRRIGPSVKMLAYGIDPHAFDEAAGDATDGDSASISDGDATGHRRYILMSAPIDPIEGIVPLLRAVAELGYEHRDCHVVLAGPSRGDWKAQLDAAIERKGFTDRTTMVIDPDADTQAAWIRRAAVLAAPGLRIRPAFSVLQALAAGVPVVTTRDASPGAAHDLVHVCRPERHALRQALSEVLLRTDHERRRDAPIARDRARGSLSWDQLVGKWVATYLEATRTKTGSATPAA